MMRVLELEQENIYHGGQNNIKFVSPLFHYNLALSLNHASKSQYFGLYIL